MKRALALVVLVACVGKKYGPPLPPYEANKGPRVTLDGGPDDIAKKAHMEAVASLHERAIGPMLARGSKGALAAYVAGASAGATTRPIVVMGLDGVGAPTGQARIIAQAPPDTSTLVVRSAGNEGLDAGYFVAWTSLTDRGDSLSLAGVDAKGEPRASAIELARTTDHIVWVELVATSRGAVCVWAEEPASGGGANVLAQALEASGKPRGVPSRAVRAATAWQAVPTKDGVGLAIAQSGALSLARLDTEGRVVGEPTPVAKNVGADMDLVKAGDAFVFAWTDRTRVDAQLVIAGVDAQNKVVSPHDALPDAGSSALVTIAGGEGGALVLWEPSHKRERITRRVHVGSLHDASSPLVTKTTLDLTGGASIDARAAGSGWALLATAHVCPLAPGATCGPAAPTFLKLDASLSTVQTEALVQGPPVSIAWGMDCGKDSCLALAAGSGLGPASGGSGLGPEAAAPTTVYAVDLATRPSTHAPPISPPIPDDAPRVVSTTTLTTGTQVGDIASGNAGDVSLVAAIVGTGVDDKTHEERMALRIAAVGKSLAPVTLKTKALSTGGVALAPGPGPKQVTLAYVARERGGAQVHLVHVDDHLAVTDAVLSGLASAGKGDASDVSLVAVQGGYVVAWVDTRDGNGEVYAAKVTGDVAGPAMRITNAPGDATDTALTMQGTSVVLAWADPRESPHDGFADIYAIALSPKDAKPLAKEARVLSTAAHSRSPVLAHTSQGAALAWIEEAPAGAASEEAKGAMFALLDEHARPLRDPIKLRLRDEGIVTAITLDADATTRLLHAVVARTSQDELWLDGARIPLDAGGSLESYPLVALDGPSSMDVALSLRGDDLLYSDEAGTDDARIKRGSLAWKK